ncbi:MAG: rhodanese-like domain-containing protein [Burkholderiaceae bacterium]
MGTETLRFVRSALAARTLNVLATVVLAGTAPSAAAQGSLPGALSQTAIQTVGDGACPTYAVDIESFASCDGDKVVAPLARDFAIQVVPKDGVPARKRPSLGQLVSAAEAQRVLQAHPRDVVLIDIRSRVEAVYVGQPSQTRIHVPYLEPAWPLQWDAAKNGLKMQRNPGFVDEVRAALARNGVGEDATILLLCRSGDRSAHAADALAAAGLPRVYSIVDGFEGDLGPGGKRDVNGWKNVGSDWQARPVAGVLYGAQR